MSPALRMMAPTFSAWSSPQFRDVSLHRTVMVDGVSRMRSAGEQTVPAGAVLRLEPGGLHLMLMGPSAALTEGQAVEIVMEDTAGVSHRFELVVERR